MASASAGVLLAFSGDQRGDGPRCFGLHARQHVDVLFERERWRLVPEPFAHDLDWNAPFEGEAGMRMAKVV